MLAFTKDISYVETFWIKVTRKGQETRETSMFQKLKKN